MQETQVRSLGQEGPLEKETATHSSICLTHHLPKKLSLTSLQKEIATHSSIFASSWTEEPIGLLSTGLQSQTRLTDSTALQQGTRSHIPQLRVCMHK